MHASATPVSNAVGAEVPLVVDMDGTLINSDSLHESLLVLFKRNPLFLFMLPVWLLAGKAAFKKEVADRVELDVEALPYDVQLLEHLRAQRGQRRLVLCTAADHRFANAVAAHLGLFDEVIATQGEVNLSGGNKAAALVERFGARGFDYAGDDVKDLKVFAQARRAILVNPTSALKRREKEITNVERTLEKSSGFQWSAHLRVMRPIQWVKNLLVYVPMVATLNMSDLSVFVPASLAFLSFSLLASSVYLLNDLLDLGADRRHPRKRLRPLAAGTVPIQHALVMIPVLLIAAFLFALRIGPLFVLTLAVYYASTNLYTFWLKRVVLLDTLVLSGLYTLRILAGAAAILVVPSFWLLAFSMFFFLSIALAKRHAELVELEGTGQWGSIPGRQYRKEDLSTLISQGSASGYAAVLVLALYIDSAHVQTQYTNPELIWLICPLLLYWINKLWLNAQRRQITDDPLVWAISNRVSRAIAVLSVLLLLLARWLPPLF